MRERGRDLWPVELAGLGPRRVIAFSPCADCAAAGGRVSTWMPDADHAERAITRPYLPGTWAAYGATALCLPHARARLAGVL